MCDVPSDWQAFGARFGDDGLLYLAEWRRGFTVHELRALFFRCQQVSTLETELRQTRAELERVQETNDELEKRTAFYRRQVLLEAQLGLALSRIAR